MSDVAGDIKRWAGRIAERSEGDVRKFANEILELCKLLECRTPDTDIAPQEDKA